MVKPSASSHEAGEGPCLVMTRWQGAAGHRRQTLLLCVLEAAVIRAPSRSSVVTGELCPAAVGPSRARAVRSEPGARAAVSPEPAAATHAQRLPEPIRGIDLHGPPPPSGEPRSRPQQPGEGRHGQRGGRATLPRKWRGCREAAEKVVSCHLHRGEEKGRAGTR